MRVQRAGQATFIPLETIQAKPANDKFRNFARGARLAIDVISFDNSVERAMQHACGDALVCDSMEVARHVCYEKRQQIKGKSRSGRKATSCTDLASQLFQPSPSREPSSTEAASSPEETRLSRAAVTSRTARLRVCLTSSELHRSSLTSPYSRPSSQGDRAPCQARRDPQEQTSCERRGGPRVGEDSSQFGSHRRQR